MEEEITLFKGELMEEKLRLYFLNNGYYVLRGVKYNYQDNEITDIDLFLYGRVSGLTRERINVEIKNKKTPKAFERIIWAKGLQKLLRFENCIVATTDKRESLREYGLKHDIIILDGNFINKLSYNTKDRNTEEEILESFSKIKSLKTFQNQSWRNIYENSKSRLLSELDFSGYNTTLLTLSYFLLKCFDKQKKESALKCVYLIMSHSLIMLDFILKDIAFLEPALRQEGLSDGFNYGNLGRSGVNRTIEMAVKISNSKISASVIKKSLNSSQTDILKEYFSKSEVSRNLFHWAIELEKIAFGKVLVSPSELASNLKGVLGIYIDYFKINRKDFFEIYESSNSVLPHPIEP